MTDEEREAEVQRRLRLPTLVAQAFAFDYAPPLIQWNADGTRFLLYSPRSTPE